MVEKLPTVDGDGRVSDNPKLHAGLHTDGVTDPISEATVSDRGLMSATDKTKLDGVAAGADVTGSNPPQAHGTSHTDGSDNIADFAGSGTKGLVPDPTSETGKYLKDDGTWASPSGTGDEKVAVTSNDTTPGYLNGKLIEGSGIDLTVGTPGGDETLEVAVDESELDLDSIPDTVNYEKMTAGHEADVDAHHDKSHDHSSASGSGAIATDQIAKFGDGGTTDYCEIQTDGKFRAYGAGRFKRVQYVLAPSMAIGGNMSFNGATYLASTYTLISATDRPALFRRFDYTNPLERNYAICQTVLPPDYVAGTDFKIKIAWCASPTTGNVVWTIGILPVSDGDSYDQTPSYQTASAQAVSGTSYGRVTTEITVTGTNFNPGDCLSLVLLRVAGSGSDTLDNDAYVAGIGIEYISDKLGADV